MQSAVEQIGFLYPDPVDQQLWALSLIRDQSYRPPLNIWCECSWNRCVPLIWMIYSILLSACNPKWVLKEPLPGMFCNWAHFYIVSPKTMPYERCPIPASAIFKRVCGLSKGKWCVLDLWLCHDAKHLKLSSQSWAGLNPAVMFHCEH